MKKVAIHKDGLCKKFARRLVKKTFVDRVSKKQTRALTLPADSLVLEESLARDFDIELFGAEWEPAVAASAIRKAKKRGIPITMHQGTDLDALKAIPGKLDLFWADYCGLFNDSVIRTLVYVFKYHKFNVSPRSKPVFALTFTGSRDSGPNGGRLDLAIKKIKHFKGFDKMTETEQNQLARYIGIPWIIHTIATRFGYSVTFEHIVKYSTVKQSGHLSTSMYLMICTVEKGQTVFQPARLPKLSILKSVAGRLIRCLGLTPQAAMRGCTLT